MRQLLVGRSGDRDDLVVARIEGAGQPPDGAALAGRVPALEEDDAADLLLVTPSVGGEEPRLELVQTLAEGGLRQRAGFAEDAKAIQALWLDGRRDAAAQRVPDAMITEFQALGTPGAIDDSKPPEWELFDLDADPYELNSVYDDPAYADTQAALKSELSQLQARLADEP